MNHVEAQDQTIQLGTLYGWRHLHVRRTIGRGKKWTTATNRKGWPDLFFWHPGRGGCFAVEIKIPPDPVSEEQQDVMDELAAAGIPVFVWTPADLEEAKRTFDTLRGRQPPNRLLEADRLLRSIGALVELPYHLAAAVDAFLEPEPA